MARYERRDWGPGSDRRAEAAAGRWMTRNAPSRRAPQSVHAQARYIRTNVYGGNTKRMAEAYGVTPRTVQRWIKGDRHGTPAERERLGRDVAGVRRRRAERRARLAARRGAPMRVKAKGWIGPTGATARGRARDTPTTRLREMPEMELTPAQEAAVVAGYELDDPALIREALAEVYGEYFTGNAPGHGPTAATQWTTGADVGELDWIEFES